MQNPTRSSMMWLAVAALACACGGTSASQATAAAPAPQQPQDRSLPPSTAPAPPTFRLPLTAAPIEYAAELTLDADAETFAGSIAIDVDFKAPTTVLWLNGRDLTMGDASIEIGGRTLEAGSISIDSDEFVGLTFPESVGPGTGKVRIAYTGKVSDTELSGVFRQKEGDRWYLFTQFEAIDARRAFPSFDEPHHKTPWQLTIRAPEGQVAFTNTPEVGTQSGDGFTTYTFAKTKPIPSYLVAFAVGPFDVVDAGTAGRNDTPLRIIVPRGQSADAAYAVKVTGEILETLEAYFDHGYPYAKLDSIAVPDFFGAMENPGLITYAQRILLTAPGEQTPMSERMYAGIAAHEIAHQWFGNLVTMKWWDDLWLNESFATWVAAKAIDTWKPEWNGEIRAMSGRNQAMEADQLLTAKAVRQPVESRADIFSGGSSIIYAKGNAVLTAFERWVGEDAFQRGIRSYIEQHAWGNAAAEDFLAALGAASSPELSEAFATFIDQPGYPLVEAKLRCDGDTPALELSQQRYLPTGADDQAGDALWQIPVCARYPTGAGKQTGRDCMLMKETTGELTLSEATSCPAWVLANDAAAGYYRVAYDGELIEANLVGAGAKQLTVPERIALIGDVSALVNAGRMSPTDAFTMVPKVLTDRNPHLVRATVGIVRSVDDYLVPDELRANYARFVRKMYGAQARKLGWKPKQGESDDARMLRPYLLSLVAVQGDDPRLARDARKLADAWMKDPSAVDPDIADVALEVAARHGDRALYDRMLAQTKQTEDRDHRGKLLGALSQFRGLDMIRENFALMLDGPFEFREAAVLMQGALQNPATREAAYELVKDNIDAIIAKLPSFYAKFVVYTAGGFCDEQHAKDAEAFFGDRVQQMMGGPAALAQVLERVRLCAAQREAQQPSVASFLKKY